jgi:hypothetical protein
MVTCTKTRGSFYSGYNKLHRLEENVGGSINCLSADDLREIDHALSDIEVQGARYSEQAQKMINR